ncbi:hypothetical protein FRC08_010224 [Ceratobasidium sp. 394]|nr:hypothetical protein FRC08_010224 [Ceratobasidium sp. 394]
MPLLHIPELATLICSFSTPPDCARLSRTSRALFDITAPFIWGHVDGVKNLLALLEPTYSSRNPDQVVLDLRGAASKPNAFSRFDFYAPHVKTLDIYGRKMSSFGINGWPVLISRAQQRPLLPNLECLRIKAANHPDGANQPLWIAAFASPSLTTLSIQPNPYSPLSPIIPHRAAAFILQLLERCHPDLKQLDLFPSREADQRIGDGGSILRPFLPKKTLTFYQHLAGFTSLTHLSGTYAWFEKKPFLVLSRLPHLESISIYLDEDETGPYDRLDSLLSDDSFPSLRELTLDRSRLYQALTLMEAKRFVGRLTTLRLGIEDVDFGFDDIHGEWELEDSGFPRLFQSVPRLNHLEVTVYEADVLLPFNYLILPTLLELPLQSLVLRGVTLEDIQMATEELEAVWPQLTELRVPDYDAPLSEIALFEVVPSLRFLELKLHLLNPKGPSPFHEQVPHTSLEVLKSSEGGHMCSSPEEMDIVVRTLLFYWPKLKRIEWTTDDVPTLGLVEQLNNKLEVARQSQIVGNAA